jgi:hypothetical protein
LQSWLAGEIFSGGTNYLNHRFDIGVIFMTNYFLVRSDVPINNKTHFVTDFVNLKIKSTQSFKDAHMDMLYVHMFMRMSAHTYINICVYPVFLKQKSYATLVGVNRPDCHDKHIVASGSIL